MASAKKVVNEKPFVEEENFTSRKKIKIVDLFAGIGGFHYGIAAAAAKIDHGVKPLLVSEIEPSCPSSSAEGQFPADGWRGRRFIRIHPTEFRSALTAFLGEKRHQRIHARELRAVAKKSPLCGCGRQSRMGKCLEMKRQIGRRDPERIRKLPGHEALWRMPHQKAEEREPRR